MSPSARGLVPGLLLALLAAFAVLAANDHWLLPGLGESGVRFLSAAPDLAGGRAPSVPIASWDAPSATSGLEGQGKLVPWLMAAGVSAGARPHVAGLWVLAASAAAAILGICWAVGGVAGIPGAVAAGSLALVSPLAVEASTVLGTDVTVAALFMILLGAMTYRPRGYALHGTVAALAWAAGATGIGAVGAVVLWPLVRRAAPGERWLGASVSLAPVAALVLLAFRWPTLTPPGWRVPAEGSGAERVLDGLLSGAAPGLSGVAGWAAMAAVVLGAATLVVREARAATLPEGPPAWSDPRAADWLAASFRPAGLVLAAGALVGAVGASSDGGLGRPWLAAFLILTTLVAAAAVRGWRLWRGSARWAPIVALALWGGASARASDRALDAAREVGRGVTAEVWVESPVVRWIDNRSAGFSEIYAAEPALVVLQSGRPARSLPAPDSGPDGAEMERFAAHFAAHPGAVVLTGPAWTEDAAERLAHRLGLREVVRAEEGRVLVPAGAEPG